jgi:hypothetical protein
VKPESNGKTEGQSDGSGSWEDDDTTGNDANNGSQTGNSSKEDTEDVSGKETYSDEKKWGDIY